jgi:hypothetical protein
MPSYIENSSLTRAVATPPPDLSSHLPHGVPANLGASADWTPRQLTELLSQILQAVYPHTFFWSGERLVEMGDAGTLKSVTAARLWALVNGQVYFEQRGSRRGLPQGYGSMVLEHAQFLFPALRAVRHAPFLTRAGWLAILPGYYAEDRIYLLYPDDALPITVDRDAAGKILKHYMSDFAYAHPYSWVTHLAMLVEPALLPYMDAPAPMELAQAPDARAGKSTASRLPAIVALGTMPAEAPLPANPVELPYTLAANLEHLSAILFLDNLPDGWMISSADLERLLTACGPVLMRKARSGSHLRVDARLTSIFGSGNRVMFTGGMTRRVVIMQLQPQPADKVYRVKDYDKTVLADRARLLGTIVWALDEWHRRGRPTPTKQFASFQRWSSVVGGVVSVLVEAWDPGFDGMALVESWLDSLGRLASPEDEDWEALLDVWPRIDADKYKPLTSAELVDLVGQLELPFLSAEMGDNPGAAAQRLGRYLTKRVKTAQATGSTIIAKGRDTHNRSIYYPVKVTGS